MAEVVRSDLEARELSTLDSGFEWLRVVGFGGVGPSWVYRFRVASPRLF